MDIETRELSFKGRYLAKYLVRTRQRPTSSLPTFPIVVYVILKQLPGREGHGVRWIGQVEFSRANAIGCHALIIQSLTLWSSISGNSIVPF